MEDADIVAEVKALRQLSFALPSFTHVSMFQFGECVDLHIGCSSGETLPLIPSDSVRRARWSFRPFDLQLRRFLVGGEKSRASLSLHATDVSSGLLRLGILFITEALGKEILGQFPFDMISSIYKDEFAALLKRQSGSVRSSLCNLSLAYRPSTSLAVSNGIQTVLASSTGCIVSQDMRQPKSQCPL